MLATGTEWIVAGAIVVFFGFVVRQLKYGKKPVGKSLGGGAAPDEPAGPPQAE